MNDLKRPRSEDDRIVYDRSKAAYKNTLVTTSAFSFTLRNHHTRYISYNQNSLLSSLDLIRKREFPLVIMKNTTYLSNVVLYDETEQELQEFYSQLICSLNQQDSDEEFSEESLENLEESKDYKATAESDRRYQAINLLNSGVPKELVCQHLKISRNQLKYYISLAEKQRLDKKARPQKILQKWFDELSLFLSNPLRRHSSLDEIRRHLTKKIGTEVTYISVNTVFKMIKKIGYSRKRSRAGTIHRNSSRVIESRRNKMLEYLALLKQKKKFIYIDETGFHRGIIPIYGYSKVGEPVIYSRKNMSANYSVICAVTQDRILGYQVFQGGVTAEAFGSFIINLLDDNQEIKDNLGEWIIYMDNAPIHKAKILQPFFERFRSFYGPPYSPFLNPIEEFFGLWKHYFRKELLNEEQDTLMNIVKSLKNINENHVKKFYLHSLKFIEASIRSEQIS